MVEAMRLVGAALHAWRSSAGRTVEAIAIEAECVVVREVKLSVERGMIMASGDALGIARHVIGQTPEGQANLSNLRRCCRGL